MEQNQIVHGFKVDKIVDVAELEATAYFLTHQKTKAQLLYLEREDDNKTFSIAFKTIPTDDTGVFHILEHSVLNGSEKYPLKEPFVDLLKGSLQTFLNAITYPDKTVYPVSSRNKKDFINLTRVYLDAVFKPNCKKNANVFYQEGWHYELKNKEDDLSYKGVVYNEMQGAYASSERMADQYLMNYLYPNNCYRYSSGGDPKHIPDLTYQQFCQAHDTYYHPTNSMIFLDGKMDVEEMLQIINDEYLDHYTENLHKYTIEKQQPVINEKIVKEYAVVKEEDLKNKTIINFGYVIGNYDDFTSVAAMEILSRVLAENNDSVLTKAIISQGLAENVTISLENSILQPYLSITVSNTEEQNYAQIKKTIEDTLLSVVKKGIDKKLLTAILNRMEFTNKEKDFGAAPKGVIYDIWALNSWNYGGNPLDALTNDAIYKDLRGKINSDYFEKLISDLILNSKHWASIILRPEVGLDKKQQAEVQAKLKSYKDNLLDAEIEKLWEFNKQFSAWQLMQDSEDVKAMLPKLELSDIDDKPQKIEKKVQRVDNIDVLVYPTTKNDIVYVNELYRCDDLSLNEISLLSLLKNLIGDLNTEKYSAEELIREKSAYLGYIDLSSRVYSDYHHEGNYKYILDVTYSFLKENQEQALSLIDQLLNHTLFNNKETILNIIKQIKTSLEMDISMYGHVYGMRRVRSSLNEEGMIIEYDCGYSYYEFIKGLLNEDIDAVINRLQNLYSKIFSESRLTLALYDEKPLELTADILRLRNDEGKVDFNNHKKLNEKKNEGIVITGAVGYGEMAADISGQIDDFRGQMAVINKILSLDYLWNTVRAQGGAYGVGVTTSANSVTFYSFRDPKPLNSIATYKKCAQYLTDLADSNENLEKYIIGTIGDSEPILTNKSKMQIGNVEYFTNYTYEDRCNSRHQVLNTTKEDLLKAAKIYDYVAKNAHLCIVADKETIEGCSEIERVLNL
ncbi:MAG: insulinase family protein [Erysipelotrichia bacterium]|nr:insulinase family protein [Erysipelotrichia bacterium]